MNKKRVLETLYLLVCISAGLQQPKQAESLASACREMRRRLSGNIQTSIYRKPAFKKITHAVQLNGYAIKQKQHLNKDLLFSIRFEACNDKQNYFRFFLLG